MDKYEIRRMRLQELIAEHCNGKQSEAARKLGVSDSYVARMLYKEGRKGQKRIGEDMIERIAAAFSVTAWLLDTPFPDLTDGKQPKKKGELGFMNWVKDEPMSNEDRRFALSNLPSLYDVSVVTILLDEQYAPGFDTRPVLDHGVAVKMGVPLNWMKQASLAKADLIAVEFDGTSMQPSIMDGDRILLSTAKKVPVDGAVFALNYEGNMVVRRLIRDAGEWWLTCDNNTQREFAKKVFTPETTQILGQVIRKESVHI